VPVLRALGWDVEDLEEVKLEYRRRANDNPVDYALFVNRTPRLFIEAKGLGVNLDDPKPANQILGYAMAAGVEWVALTDGNRYLVYNSHAAVPVEQKLFRDIRISDAASSPDDTLALLSKAQLTDHLIDELWKAHFIDRQIRVALETMFGPEPDASLVRVIRTHVPSLAPGEIRSALARLRTTFDFPLVAPGPHPVAAPPPGHPNVPLEATPAPKGPRPPNEVTQYVLTPVKDEHGTTGRATLESLLGQGVYVFSEHAIRQTKIRRGDRIAFYWSGVGVVADAVVSSSPDKRQITFAKVSGGWPWAFDVSEVRFYFDSPVVIDPALRSRLQVFVDHGHDPNGPWSWFVQGTRKVTPRDFDALTRR